MSYDISVVAPVVTGGETVLHTLYERGFTYNNSGIMYAIGCGRDDLSGKLASEVVERIANGIRLLQSEPSKYRDKEPSNGWGGIEDCLNLLNGLLGACRAAPLARIEYR